MKKKTNKPMPAARRGKPFNVYLHAEDMTQIRKLGGWLAMKGFRVSDSQVIRAALRLAKPGDALLLETFEDILAADGRLKQNR